MTSRRTKLAALAVCTLFTVAATGCTKAQSGALIGAGIGAAAGYYIGHEADKDHSHGNHGYGGYGHRRGCRCGRCG